MVEGLSLLKWSDAVRRLEIAGKQLISHPGDLSLCPFDSFIYPTAPWVCLICHRIRRWLKRLPQHDNPGVITGGWWRRDEEGAYYQARQGGFFQERWGRKPAPWAHWIPAKFISDDWLEMVELQVRVFFTLGQGKMLCHRWGLKHKTTFEMDVKVNYPYVRVEAHHPAEAKTMKYTLFVP